MEQENSKFNILNGNEVYADLEKLIWHVAWACDNPDNVMMNAEEIAGELSTEVAKGLVAYQHLPRPDLIKVLKGMIGYRISELKYKNYLTHRKAAKLTVSLELEDADNGEKFGIPSNVEDTIESNERLHTLYSSLSVEASNILFIMLNGSDSLNEVLSKYGITYKDKIKPEHIVEALQDEDGWLGITLDLVRKCFEEIKRKYREVYADE